MLRIPLSGSMRIRVLSVALCMVCAVSAQAFRFEPISQEFAPSGAGSNHLFRVENTTNERIAVRIAVRPREIQRDGTEVLGEESPEFTVFPRNVLLDPGNGRSIRVQWNGPASVETEQAYRIIAEQVPIALGGDLPTQGGGIRLTYRYEGTVYVTPPRARPDVRVVSVSRETQDSERFLRVTLENVGTRHAILRGAELALTYDPDIPPRIELESGDLRGLSGENMLAGLTREFVIPAPDDLWDGEIYATLYLAD
ncbi:MAG: molecular chaperone [Spirochaetaceae bacterium]|nr:MAG: molecular chaperone [Spirochaetaceae bacterium]